MMPSAMPYTHAMIVVFALNDMPGKQLLLAGLAKILCTSTVVCDMTKSSALSSHLPVKPVDMLLEAAAMALLHS